MKSKENHPLVEIYINFVVSLLALEYLILLGIRRIITTEKPRYSLSDFVTGDVPISKILFA